MGGFYSQVADHQKYNEKADVYSFSLIMWEMLAGQKPFLGESDVPPLPTSDVLSQCFRFL